LLTAMCWEKQDIGHPKFVQTTLFPDLNENEMALFTLLRQFPDGLQLNDLAIRTAMPVSKVSAMLLGMEFKGLVRISPGNLYRIVK
jgi:DNA processing protein